MANNNDTSRTRYCIQCSYPLTGLRVQECPECGRNFDVDDPRTTMPNPAGVGTIATAVTARILTVAGCVLAAALIYASTNGMDPLWLWLVGLLICPFAFVLTILVLIPNVYLMKKTRIVAIVCVVITSSILVTGWPQMIAFQLHRPALTSYVERVHSGEIKIGSGRKRVGLLTFHSIKMTPEGNIGFQQTGDSGGGVFLVHTVPESTFIWYNTNWEQYLGGGWYRVFED